MESEDSILCSTLDELHAELELLYPGGDSYSYIVPEFCSNSFQVSKYPVISEEINDVLLTQLLSVTEYVLMPFDVTPWKSCHSNNHTLIKTTTNGFIYEQNNHGNLCLVSYNPKRVKKIENRKKHAPSLYLDDVISLIYSILQPIDLLMSINSESHNSCSLFMTSVNKTRRKKDAVNALVSLINFQERILKKTYARTYRKDFRFIKCIKRLNIITGKLLNAEDNNYIYIGRWIRKEYRAICKQERLANKTKPSETETKVEGT